MLRAEFRTQALTGQILARRLTTGRGRPASENQRRSCSDESLLFRVGKTGLNLLKTGLQICSINKTRRRRWNQFSPVLRTLKYLLSDLKTRDQFFAALEKHVYDITQALMNGDLSAVPLIAVDRKARHH